MPPDYAVEEAVGNLVIALYVIELAWTIAAIGWKATLRKSVE